MTDTKTPNHCDINIATDFSSSNEIRVKLPTPISKSFIVVGNFITGETFASETAPNKPSGLSEEAFLFAINTFCAQHDVEITHNSGDSVAIEAEEEIYHAIQQDMGSHFSYAYTSELGLEGMIEAEQEWLDGYSGKAPPKRTVQLLQLDA